MILLFVLNSILLYRNATSTYVALRAQRTTCMWCYMHSVLHACGATCTTYYTYVVLHVRMWCYMHSVLHMWCYMHSVLHAYGATCTIHHTHSELYTSCILPRDCHQHRLLLQTSPRRHGTLLHRRGGPGCHHEQTG